MKLLGAVSSDCSVAGAAGRCCPCPTGIKAHGKGWDRDRTQPSKPQPASASTLWCLCQMHACTQIHTHARAAFQAVIRKTKAATLPLES